MKMLGAVASNVTAPPKRERHRKWLWSRLENDFFENPVFRAAAELTGLPLFQVAAIAGRLECLANKSDPRGYVGDFRPVEFGAALGMPAEEAARIFAALEHHDIQWLDQGFVVTFYERNPDKLDLTAAERDRRRKARNWIRKELQKRVDNGSISWDQREGVVAMLPLFPDEQLVALRKKLGEGVALEHALLSTGHAGHAVASRDSVAATPRAELTKANQPPNVDNFGTATRGETSGPSNDGAEGAGGDPQQAARLWIGTEGRRLAIERMAHEQPGRVETLLQRWLEQDLEGDALALMSVLTELSRVPLLTGAKFHVELTNRCAQHRRMMQARGDLQNQLPLTRLEGVKKTG